jgi:hypothetical protein
MGFSTTQNSDFSHHPDEVVFEAAVQLTHGGTAGSVSDFL